jgi:thioredoxin reductase (NADPH)
VRIVDPTSGLPGDAEVAPVAHDGIPEDALCLLSNSKPGATELLRGVAARLEAERGFADIGFASKPQAAHPTAEETLDHLAARYRMAIVAIGD